MSSELNLFLIIYLFLFLFSIFSSCQVTVQTSDEKLGRMVTRVVLPRVVMHSRHHYGVSCNKIYVNFLKSYDLFICSMFLYIETPPYNLSVMSRHFPKTSLGWNWKMEEAEVPQVHT
jgi:hypothetical protein